MIKYLLIWLMKNDDNKIGKLRDLSNKLFDKIGYLIKIFIFK